MIANIGVLVGIFIVAFELNQTQIAMQAEASTMRTQMAQLGGQISDERMIPQIVAKLREGEELSAEESRNYRYWSSFYLRYFENLHYQYQLGVLDEEIWSANVFGIRGTVCNSAFNQLFNWPTSAGSYRESFVEYALATCE
ncbi:MAG: hypothetical protein RL120_14575 [Gammaproteobacteria bacterium]